VLASVWFARRGSLLGLLLWPGALLYVLYTYALYLVGAPFGPLFLGYVLLAVVSAFAWWRFSRNQDEMFNRIQNYALAQAGGWTFAFIFIWWLLSLGGWVGPLPVVGLVAGEAVGCLAPGPRRVEHRRQNFDAREVPFDVRDEAHQPDGSASSARFLKIARTSSSFGSLASCCSFCVTFCSV